MAVKSFNYDMSLNSCNNSSGFSIEFLNKLAMSEYPWETAVKYANFNYPISDNTLILSSISPVYKEF